MRATWILVTALGLAATPALADSSSNPLDTRVFKNGFWVGGGVDWSSVDVDGTSYDDDAFGFNVGGGYQFANYFGVNAKWRDLGGFSDQGYDLDVDGFTVGLTAGYPITQRIAVIGGGGYFDFNYDASGSGLSDSDDDNGLYLNAGVASEVGRFVVQPGVVWYDADGADLWSLEVNFYWKLEAGN